ncbi:unnamed protein product [Ranitomeya imitator]|uniref:Uncharacterized protein n=1 Tax=Ranitomeya imitator TaxID=111125 RepID=A0ABN9MSB0_9NEOB|nr:unnamed protein product [Ranitomeya imitator]
MKVGANPTHDAYVASWKDHVPADRHVNSLCGFRSVLHLFLKRNPQVKSAQKTLEIHGEKEIQKEGPFPSSARTEEQTTPNKVATERVSMNFSTLKHLSKNSTFNPILPNTYKSTEMLSLALLDQAYAHDKLCISKSMFHKTNKRLQMMAKLVYTFEDSICRPEHVKAEEVSKPDSFYCHFCVENKKVNKLETHLQKSDQSTTGRSIVTFGFFDNPYFLCRIYYSNMDIESASNFTSTDALVNNLREDLAAKSQTIADLHQVISNLGLV